MQGPRRVSIVAVDVTIPKREARTASRSAVLSRSLVAWSATRSDTSRLGGPVELSLPLLGPTSPDWSHIPRSGSTGAFKGPGSATTTQHFVYLVSEASCPREVDGERRASERARAHHARGTGSQPRAFIAKGLLCSRTSEEVKAKSPLDSSEQVRVSSRFRATFPRHRANVARGMPAATHLGHRASVAHGAVRRLT